MPWTTRGIELLFDWAFRAATRPAHYYLALVTSATTPTGATKTLGDLTEVANGHGYVSGGFQLDPNSTDFNALVADDTNHWTYVGIKNISWTASGGDIPISGSPPAHIVLTTDAGAISAHPVIWYQTLGGDRTIVSGNTLSVTGIQGRIQGGSVIKSIQRGTITLATTASSNTATITSVDTTKSVVQLNGFNSNNSSDSNVAVYLPRVDLTNATTVTANRGITSSLNGTVTINFQVTEYY